MAHKSVDVMLSRPGIYVVIAASGVSLCEVENGRAFQLSLNTYERDGELPAGRWNLRFIRGILGPFARQRTDCVGGTDGR